MMEMFHHLPPSPPSPPQGSWWLLIAEMERRLPWKRWSWLRSSCCRPTGWWWESTSAEIRRSVTQCCFTLGPELDAGWLSLMLLLLMKVGHGKDLLPALQSAKNCGLKLSLHLSEVGRRHFFLIELYCSHWTNRLFTQQKSRQVLSQLEETDLLLDLPPDRIGHGTFLHPEVGGSEDLVQKVLKNNIPLGKTWGLAVVPSGCGVLNVSPLSFLQSCVWPRTSKVKLYRATPNTILITGTSWDIHVWFV